MSQGDHQLHHDEEEGFEPAEGQAAIQSTANLNSGSARSATSASASHHPPEPRHSFVMDGSHADTNASTATASWLAETPRTEVPDLLRGLSVEQLLAAHQTILRQLTSHGYHAQPSGEVTERVYISDDSPEHHQHHSHPSSPVKSSENKDGNKHHKKSSSEKQRKSAAADSRQPSGVSKAPAATGHHSSLQSVTAGALLTFSDQLQSTAGGAAEQYGRSERHPTRGADDSSRASISSQAGKGQRVSSQRASGGRPRDQRSPSPDNSRNSDGEQHSSSPPPAKLKKKKKKEKKQKPRSKRTTDDHSASEGSSESSSQPSERQKKKKKKGKARTKSRIGAGEVDFKQVRLCPVCGRKNERIKGDLKLHYFTCEEKRTNFNPNAAELVLLNVVSGARRKIRGRGRSSQRDSASEEDEGGEAESEQHHPEDRELGSEDSDTTSDSEYQDEYEDEEGSTESSASTSSSESLAKRKSQAKPSSGHSKEQSRFRSKVASAPVKQERLSADLHQPQRLEQQQYDARFLRLESMIQMLVSQKEGSAVNTVPPQQLHGAHQHQLSPIPHQALSWQRARMDPREEAQEQEDPFDQADTIHITAMAGWPVMPLEDIGNASKFAPWKRLYDEYVSKCTDKQRTPATMSQAFHKWAQWFATAFTEQERQRQEQELPTQRADARAAGAVRTFSATEVLALTDSEFTRRYLAFCQVKIKDPSQVLQLLGTPKIDASSGGLVELMQASQSFTEQLKLIPKAALQQCQPYQIRDAFITSVFGSEQFRDKKVDYLQCNTWNEVCEFMIRKASGPFGSAFTPFKTLKEFTKRPSEKERSSERDRDKGDKPGDDQAEPAKPDMSLKTEQKWKAKFTDLASDQGIRNPRHAFASSWKIRYAYLLDCISQGSEKCSRCRRKRNHLPSNCDDPLPEVPYPSLSEEQAKALRGLRLTAYDEDGNSVQRPSAHGGKQEDRDLKSRSQDRDDTTRGQQSAQQPSRARGSSHERDRQSNNCFRCEKPGHRASDCTETKHADGTSLPAPPSRFPSGDAGTEKRDQRGQSPRRNGGGGA
jgi:hypothetical protein